MATFYYSKIFYIFSNYIFSNHINPHPPSTQKTKIETNHTTNSNSKLSTNKMLPFPPLYNSEQESPLHPPLPPETTQAYILPNPENPGYYQCTICLNFEMKTKHKVKEHVKECLRKQQKKNKKQEENKIIDTNNLYGLIIQLQKEVATLKQQVKDMKKHEIQRINIQFWLNNHCTDQLPRQTFYEWRKSTLFYPTDNQLQLVFQYNIKKGIQECIRNLLETENPASFPIRAFDKQRHIFYIYEYPPQPQQHPEEEEPEPEWRKMTKEDFHVWLEWIATKFALKFEEWEKINEEWLENETNNEERIKYSKKILQEIETIEPQTIRCWLYDELKRPLTRIVELDFEDV